MEQFFNSFIEKIMDAIEEFFEALIVPTQRYILGAFYVSLIFLGWSLLAFLFGIFSFVSWQEALTCVILLGVIVLIDSSTRSKIAGNMFKIKGLTSRFIGEEEYDEPDDIDEEVLDNNEQGEQ